VSVAQATDRHLVGRVEDFPEGEFRIFELAGRPVGVVRAGETIYACRNRCPHQGAEICRGPVSGTMQPSRPFEYSYSDEVAVVSCPWHRWEFGLGDGASYGKVTKKRLVTYPVEVEDDDVYVVLRAKAATR
jgi:nitrite reductase (NADH) small subunit